MVIELIAFYVKAMKSYDQIVCCCDNYVKSFEKIKEHSIAKCV